MSAALLVPAGGLLGALAGYAAIRLSGRVGLVSGSNSITQEARRRVPLVGGVAMWLGAALALGAVRPVGAVAALSVLGALLPFLILGAVDDARPMRPGPKFALQAVCAGPVVMVAGAPDITGLAAADRVLAVFVVLVLVNAFNFIDVADGVAGSVGLAALLGWAAVAPDVRTMCLALAGGAIGFLWHNRPAARMFMGDAGSHLLGAACAVALLRYLGDGSLASQAAAGALLVSVPLFDLCFTMWVRAASGRPVYVGSPDHVPLRLRRAGLGPWAVMGAMALAAACTSAAGVAAAQAAAPVRFGALAIAAALGIVAAGALRRTDAPRAPESVRP